MTARTIVLNPIEPALLSLRSALGIDLDLAITFLAQNQSPVDPASLMAQLALLPRSSLQVFAYDLSGTGTTNECSGSYIVQAVITGVTLADAQALSQRVDGINLSATTVIPNATSTDVKGRVKYLGTADPTTVYVYLTHR